MKNTIFILSLFLLIIAGAFVFFETPNTPPKTPFQARRKSFSPKDSHWPIFRGHRGLTGQVDSIPEKVVEKWRFKAQGSIEAGVALGYGMVYFGTKEGKFYGLGIEDGKKIWEVNTGGGITATALLMDEKEPQLYIGDEDGTFRCLKAKTGRELWRFKCDQQICGGATYFKEKNQIKIVFGSYDFKLHCLNPKTGKEFWSIETENYINGTPAISGPHLVFGGCDGFFRIVNLQTGKETKKIKLNSYIPSSPAVEGNTAFLTLYKSTICALDLTSQKILWTWSDKKAGTFLSPPAINSRYVVGADQKGLIHILDKKTGKKYRTLSVSGKVDSDPVVDEKRVLVADRQGSIYLFEMETGRQIWRIRQGPAIRGPLVVCQGRIYAGNDDGYLIVYGE